MQEVTQLQQSRPSTPNPPYSPHFDSVRAWRHRTHIYDCKPLEPPFTSLSDHTSHYGCTLLIFLNLLRKRVEGWLRKGVWGVGGWLGGGDQLIDGETDRV